MQRMMVAPASLLHQLLHRQCQCLCVNFIAEPNFLNCNLQGFAPTRATQCFLEQKCCKVLLCDIPALVSPPCHWSNRGRERSLNSLGSRRRIENTAHYAAMCFTAELVHLRASPEAPTSTVCRWKAHKLVSVLRWIPPRWNVAGKLGVRL